jgi:hypothetical protein
MTKELYRYVFVAAVPLEEIEESLLLAVTAAECLHGCEQVRLDTEHYLDHKSRSCVIDAATQVGRDLNRLFLGFLRRGFGEDSFRVEHVSGTQ